VQFVLPAIEGAEPLMVKLWQAEVVDGAGRPGEVLEAGPAGWVIACGERALSLKVLQKPGGRRIGVRDFLAATPVSAGQCLGA
jgi:methionyl-tRNA formyltransferase